MGFDEAVENFLAEYTDGQFLFWLRNRLIHKHRYDREHPVVRRIDEIGRKHVRADS